MLITSKNSLTANEGKVLENARESALGEVSVRFVICHLSFVNCHLPVGPDSSTNIVVINFSGMSAN